MYLIYAILFILMLIAQFINEGRIALIIAAAIFLVALIHIYKGIRNVD